jgi:hypothetical protein
VDQHGQLDGRFGEIAADEWKDLVLRRMQMVQFRRIRHARPCAGHPRKPAGHVPPIVDGRDEPGHDVVMNLVSASEH